MEGTEDNANVRRVWVSNRLIKANVEVVELVNLKEDENQEHHKKKVKDNKNQKKIKKKMYVKEIELYIYIYRRWVVSESIVLSCPVLSCPVCEYYFLILVLIFSQFLLQSCFCIFHCVCVCVCNF